MATTFYPDGIGGTQGDSLALASPLVTSGNIWYVSSVRGTDAASPAGQDRTKPLATVAQAVTNASAEDIIVMLSDHTESVGSEITVSKAGLVFVGEGSAGGIPTVTLTRAPVGPHRIFNVTAARVQIRNVKFPATPTTADATERILAAGSGFGLIGCYAECGQYDTGPVVLTVSADFFSKNSTYISVATSTSAQPESAIKDSGSASGFRSEGDVFSGGTAGFSNYTAVDLSTSVISGIRMEGTSLLLGADVKIHASSTGYVNIQTATGGSRVRW